MSHQSHRQIQSSSLLLLACLQLLAVEGSAYAAEAGRATDTPAAVGQTEAEIAPRGQRSVISEIRYGDWRKVCFTTSAANMLCRTTISGTWETGQSAVRADLIEREGQDTARLQLFLPVGLYLPAGVKLIVDSGQTYQIPYTWCLTNTCVAADVAEPELIQQMEAGQTLVLQVVDSNVVTITTSLPLGQFAAVRKNAPAQLFEQGVAE
jgi:invasion protein IalB